jgi:3-phosphoshikimate 1-carboxyvinyltransferase
MSARMPFHFSGTISASKSILNRLLVIQSFASPKLQIKGDSNCEDVLAMRRALPAVLAANGDRADCGAAGTTFRFLALRASRVPGRHFLSGTQQLLKRPQVELLNIFEQLGVRAKFSEAGLLIESKGWQRPASGILQVARSQSSQFASAVILSAWNLDFDLRIAIGQGLSEGYLTMTESLVKLAGMNLLRDHEGVIEIPAHSLVQAASLLAESDLSSCFAIAAVAAARPGSRAVFQSFPEKSLQPDSVFVSILERMGAQIKRQSSGYANSSDTCELTVEGTETLSPIEVDLSDCPDLFPVLATLCAFTPGRSTLFGAPHLAFKESSRIQSTESLLSGLGFHVEARPDGMVIEGRKVTSVDFDKSLSQKYVFDPQDDHRLAMAAGLARVVGFKFTILHPEVVNKSFPEFWEILREGGVSV